MKQTDNVKRNHGLQYILAFSIPVLILMVAYAWNGIYPFGNATLLNGDLQSQYVDFYAYLHDILHGDASGLYTFSKAIGGNMVDILTYYLTSPFNLIFYFFEAKDMPLAIFILSTVKIGLAGAAMDWFLQRRNTATWTLLFSTAYALSGYVLSYQFQHMWLDGVILLPLMVAGIEKIKADSMCWLYMITLTAAIITNYYIGFMFCIFSVLYFMIYRILLQTDHAKANWRIWRQYIVGSVLAGMLSAVVLLPTLFALRSSKLNYVGFQHLFEFYVRFPMWKLPYRLLPGTFTIDQIGSEAMPLVYSGLLAAVCCVCYFFSKAKWKEKLGQAILLVILLGSMVFNGPYQIWHGAAYPAGYQTRFSFIFIFCVIHIGALFFASVMERSEKAGHIGSAGASGMKLVMAVLAVLVCIEYSFNAITEYSRFTFAPLDKYMQTQAENGEMVAAIKLDQDNVFSRVAMQGTDTLNAAWMYNYQSTSSYTSCESLEFREYMCRMGLSSNGSWLSYKQENTTESLNALLGIKHIAIPKERAVPDFYERIAENDAYNLYRNPNALPLGFFVSPKVTEVDTLERNSIVLQNNVWKAMTGDEQVTLYEEVSTGITMNPGQDRGTILLEKPTDTYYYLYIPTTEDVRVSVNGKDFGEVDNDNHVLNLAGFQQETSLQLELTNTKTVSWEEIKVYAFDPELLEQCVGKLVCNTVRVADIQMINDANILIQTQNEETDPQYYMLTIPEESKSWLITIDHEKVDSISALSNFTMIQIPTGEHTIRMEYIPRGLAEGILISLLGLVLAAWYGKAVFIKR
ncbi:MAG: YfhO family protein [Lachnospiraceae bacterium]|nr:YfhO family protein [Lachnospiraceae bacterium]